MAHNEQSIRPNPYVNFSEFFEEAWQDYRKTGSPDLLRILGDTTIPIRERNCSFQEHCEKIDPDYYIKRKAKILKREGITSYNEFIVGNTLEREGYFREMREKRPLEYEREKARHFCQMWDVVEWEPVEYRGL